MITILYLISINNTTNYDYNDNYTENRAKIDDKILLELKANLDLWSDKLDPSFIEQYKSYVDNNKGVQGTIYKLCEYIENHNETSAIGTLIFTNRCAKLFKTNYNCRYKREKYIETYNELNDDKQYQLEAKYKMTLAEQEMIDKSDHVISLLP